jgi:hypothetical protein
MCTCGEQGTRSSAQWSVQPTEKPGSDEITSYRTLSGGESRPAARGHLTPSPHRRSLQCELMRMAVYSICFLERRARRDDTAKRQQASLGDYLILLALRVLYLLGLAILNSFFGCLIATLHKWIAARSAYWHSGLDLLQFLRLVSRRASLSRNASTAAACSDVLCART